MLRHKWFVILVALQILNFAGMALLEQQRRTIWNKEATNIQKLADTKFFTEKTEENYRYIGRLLVDLQSRVGEIQTTAAKNAGNAALIVDIQSRVNDVQSEAVKNTGNAALIKDISDRVINLEKGFQKFLADK